MQPLSIRAALVLAALSASGWLALSAAGAAEKPTAEEYEQRGDIDRARVCLKRSLRAPPPLRRAALRRLFRMAVRLYMPDRRSASLREIQ